MRENTLISRLFNLLADGEAHTMPEMKETLEAESTQINASILQLRKKGYDIRCEQVYRMYGEAEAADETNTDKICRHLTKYGSITSEEAWEKLNINNLSTYITNLQKRGIRIQKEWEYGKSRDGKRLVVIRYRLEGWKEADFTPAQAEETIIEEEPAISPEAEERPDKWDVLKDQIEASMQLIYRTLIQGSNCVVTGKEMYNALEWVMETMQKLEGDKNAYEMGHTAGNDR